MVKVAEALVEDEAAVLQAEERQCSGEGKGARHKGAQGSEGALWAPERRADTCRAFKAAPRFVLLDFRCHVLPDSCLLRSYIKSCEASACGVLPRPSKGTASSGGERGHCP